MPYRTPAQGSHPQQCEVCGSPANYQQGGFYLIIECSRCGDFQMGREALFEWSQTPDGRLDNPAGAKQRALASHLIRRMQARSGRF
jgi:hypothetical protein